MGWVSHPLRISVYVRYLLTGEPVLVSDSYDGSDVVGASYGPAISGDGTSVAFTSVAANLVEGDADMLGGCLRLRPVRPGPPSS